MVNTQTRRLLSTTMLLSWCHILCLDISLSLQPLIRAMLTSLISSWRFPITVWTHQPDNYLQSFNFTQQFRTLTASAQWTTATATTPTPKDFGRPPLSQATHGVSGAMCVHPRVVCTVCAHAVGTGVEYCKKTAIKMAAQHIGGVFGLSPRKHAPCKARVDFRLELGFCPTCRAHFEARGELNEAAILNYWNWKNTNRIWWPEAPTAVPSYVLFGSGFVADTGAARLEMVALSEALHMVDDFRTFSQSCAYLDYRNLHPPGPFNHVDFLEGIRFATLANARRVYPPVAASVNNDSYEVELTRIQARCGPRQRVPVPNHWPAQYAQASYPYANGSPEPRGANTGQSMVYEPTDEGLADHPRSPKGKGKAVDTSRPTGKFPSPGAGESEWEVFEKVRQASIEQYRLENRMTSSGGGPSRQPRVTRFHEHIDSDDELPLSTFNPYDSSTNTGEDNTHVSQASTRILTRPRRILVVPTRLPGETNAESLRRIAGAHLRTASHVEQADLEIEHAVSPGRSVHAVIETLPEVQQGHAPKLDGYSSSFEDYEEYDSANDSPRRYKRVEIPTSPYPYGNPFVDGEGQASSPARQSPPELEGYRSDWEEYDSANDSPRRKDYVYTQLSRFKYCGIDGEPSSPVGSAADDEFEDIALSPADEPSTIGDSTQQTVIHHDFASDAGSNRSWSYTPPWAEGRTSDRPDSAVLGGVDASYSQAQATSSYEPRSPATAPSRPLPALPTNDDDADCTLPTVVSSSAAASGDSWSPPPRPTHPLPPELPSEDDVDFFPPSPAYSPSPDNSAWNSSPPGPMSDPSLPPLPSTAQSEEEFAAAYEDHLQNSSLPSALAGHLFDIDELAANNYGNQRVYEDLPPSSLHTSSFPPYPTDPRAFLPPPSSSPVVPLHYRDKSPTPAPDFDENTRWGRGPPAWALALAHRVTPTGTRPSHDALSNIRRGNLPYPRPMRDPIFAPRPTHPADTLLHGEPAPSPSLVPFIFSIPLPEVSHIPVLNSTSPELESRYRTAISSGEVILTEQEGPSSTVLGEVRSRRRSFAGVIQVQTETGDVQDEAEKKREREEFDEAPPRSAPPFPTGLSRGFEEVFARPVCLCEEMGLRECRCQSWEELKEPVVWL
ncbi:hypothetical protein GE09DRAFT_1158482 [Coniochaeta sp. 2T2.1]|nr:hypothetical protein GE09DRAFT_1158482 [Coniochaeta sp. 2T2.1]